MIVRDIEHFMRVLHLARDHGVKEGLDDQLDYLESKETQLGCEVELWPDYVPLAFGFTVYRRHPEGGRAHALSGVLIHHQGSGWSCNT